MELVSSFGLWIPKCWDYNWGNLPSFSSSYLLPERNHSRERWSAQASCHKQQGWRWGKQTRMDRVVVALWPSCHHIWVAINSEGSLLTSCGPWEWVIFPHMFILKNIGPKHMKCLFIKSTVVAGEINHWLKMFAVPPWRPGFRFQHN